MSDNDLCINIEGTSHPILCGPCQKKIAFIGEPDIEAGQAGCADCGNVDNVQEVARMATEYAKDEAQLMINRLARDTARNSKIMSFNGKTTHDKIHRFIVANFEI